MSNDNRFALVTARVAYPSHKKVEFGVLDRNTGGFAIFGNLATAEDSLKQMNRVDSGAGFAFQSADEVEVLGSLGAAPELIAPPFRDKTFYCDFTGDNALIIGRMSLGPTRAHVVIESADGAEVDVVLTPSKAVDVANAILEAAGLDARVSSAV